MNIRWSPKPQATSNTSASALLKTTRKAALKTVRTIFERVEQLVTFPHRGRMGREEDTRELVLAPLPYIVVYRVKDSAVEILHIYHGAQDR